MKAIGVSVHPAAELFPMLPDAEYAALRDDIKARGQLQPCLMWKSLWGDNRVLLDGRNRWRACAELGIEPDITLFSGSDSEAIDMIVSLNMRRRNLTPSQKAAVAAELLPMYEAAAKERQAATRIKHGNAPVTPTLEQPEIGDKNDSAAAGQAARAVGASRSYVAEAKRLRAEAPERFEAVKRGEVTISAALPKPKPTNFDVARRAVAKLTDQEWAALKRERDQEGKRT